MLKLFLIFNMLSLYTRVFNLTVQCSTFVLNFLDLIIILVGVSSYDYIKLLLQRKLVRENTSGLYLYHIFLQSYILF